MSKKKRHASTSASTPAILQREHAGVEYETVEYEHSVDDMSKGFGLEGATKLNMDPARVFKTLVAAGNGITKNLIVGIVPVSAHLDLKKLAAAAQLKKADMAPPHDAERSTGYVVGGISPFGQKASLPTFLDISALTFSTILVSGGKRGFDIVIDPQTLLEVLHATAAEIAR